MSLDLILKNGSIIDGSQDSLIKRKEDIGIKGDRIQVIGDLSDASAERIIDVAGMCVCPGFIDTHAHSDFTVIADGRAEGKISQGITTEINGNCGFSAAPLFGSALELRISDLKALDIKERWNSFSEYFEILRKKKFALNLLTLVGHGNLRASVAGYSDRELADNEKEKIYNLLENALDDGAIGLSTGLIYPPGVYSDTSELIEMAHKTLKAGGRIYASHIRNEGDELLAAIEEVIRIGLETGIHVHISHLKTSDKRNWHKLVSVFEMIAEAQQKGLRLTCDRYPYTASGTGLDAVLPDWVYDGGDEEELSRIRNDNVRIKQEMLRKYPDEALWEKVKISEVNLEKNKWMEGKSLYEISIDLKKHPIECIFGLLIEEKLKVNAIYFLMNEDNLKAILKYPYTMIGSDSSARSFDGITAKGRPHPRGFGSFPRILGRYAKENDVLSLEEAVYKMTGMPAEIFNIKHRGFIKKGYFADITVFDPDRIYDRSSFNDPFQRPEGIHFVIINGIPVVWEGEITGIMPGRVLK